MRFHPIVLALLMAAGALAANSECAVARCVHCTTAFDLPEFAIDCPVCNLCFKGQCLNVTALPETGCDACAEGWMGSLCDTEIPRTGHYVADSSLSSGTVFVMMLLLAGLVLALYFFYKRNQNALSTGGQYQTVQLTDLEADNGVGVAAAGASDDDGEVTIELVDE
eukprot:a509292_201.p2 GENE.a509292_201~~a509292_201.p2  ORF type:complete len:177 (+),score=50.33 a509292_201:36-533(+)